MISSRPVPGHPAALGELQLDHVLPHPEQVCRDRGVEEAAPQRGDARVATLAREPRTVIGGVCRNHARSGFTDGTFRTTRTITRGEAAQMMSGFSYD